MNLLLRAAAAAALLLPLAVAPATAQNYRGAFGIYGGGVWFSDVNRNGDFNILDFDVDGDFIDGDFIFVGDDFILIDNGFFGILSNFDLTLDEGWIAGAQGEYWFGNGRFGLRANAAYTERPFQLDVPGILGGLVVIENGGMIIDGEVIDGPVIINQALLNGGNSFTFGDVNTWFFDGNLMIRLLRPERDRTWAPFVNLGAGVVHYNPAGEPDVVIPAANAVFNNPATRFAGVVGLGTDILPGWRMGRTPLFMRLEVADHIAFDSPADRLIGGDDYDAVHNVRLTLGLHAGFGELFPEAPVAVAPPPAPPAPPAPPREEAITVCVIDPALPAGISNVNAIYVPASRDTLVTVEGQRVPLEMATRGVMTASQANWYIQGQPLEIEVNNMSSEFVTYGGARVVQPGDLVHLGNIDGLPVYADAMDVGTMRNDIETMRRRGADLEDILESRSDLRAAFDDIEVLYVPVDAVGCVVQPLRRVEEVRKVRG